MSNILKKIKELFSTENVEETIEIKELSFKSIEATDSNGVKVSLIINDTDIQILNSETGESSPAPIGEYQTETTIYVVKEAGVIAEEKPVEAVQNAETPKTDTVATPAQTPDVQAEIDAIKAILKALVDKVGLDVKDVKMEETKPVEMTVKIEESNLTELLDEIQKLKTELSKQPASKGIEFKKVDTEVKPTGNSMLDRLIAIKNK